MWQIIVIVAALIFFIIYKVCNKPKKDDVVVSIDNFKPGVIHDTLYYRITDVSGTVGSIHDSGIKPSKNKHKHNLVIRATIHEFNDGIETILNLPQKIEVGQSFSELKNIITLDPSNIQNHKTHYSITINNLWKA